VLGLQPNTGVQKSILDYSGKLTAYSLFLIIAEVEVFKRFDYAFIALQHYGSAKIQSDYAPY
jgi:hypothetical protein